MRQALLPYQKQYGFALNMVDVDEDENLVARYNELVPVLLHGEHEICHWHLDEAALSAYLNQVRQPENHQAA
jgi:hypothetical protein